MSNKFVTVECINGIKRCILVSSIVGLESKEDGCIITTSGTHRVLVLAIDGAMEKDIVAMSREVASKDMIFGNSTDAIKYYELDWSAKIDCKNSFESIQRIINF